jgi:two-component system sensor histidine kinase/response regulator
MILIVDDRPENLISLQKVLQAHNFEVDTASSGEEALKKVLKKQLCPHYSGCTNA